MSVYALLTISWMFCRMIGRVSMGHSMLFSLPAYFSAIGYAYSTELAVQLFFIGILLTTLSYFIFSEYTGRTAFVFLTLVLSIFVWLTIPKLVVRVDSYLVGGEVGFDYPTLGIEIVHSLSAFSLILFYLLYIGIQESKMGFMMIAIGDDETASKAIGINTRKVKLTAMFLSSSASALAGLIYAFEFGHVSPQIFSIEVSIFPFIATLISSGNPFLSVISSFVLVFLTRMLNSAYPGLMGLFYAVVLVLSPKIGRWVYAKGKKLVEED